MSDGAVVRKNKFINYAKRRRTILLTIFALFSSYVLLIPSLSLLLHPLVEEAAAQTHPDGCEKCILIEYEGVHTAVIGGVDSFTNMTTRQEQYNSYLWQFVNKLVSDGFEINAVIADDVVYEDDESSERMYHVLLNAP